MQLFETINRISRMHQLIKLEATGTPNDFAERFNIKKRQLYNILEEFRDYGACIRYDKYKCTFYYENNFDVGINIKVLPMSNQEQQSVIGGDFSTGNFRIIYGQKQNNIFCNKKNQVQLYCTGS